MADTLNIDIFSMVQVPKIVPIINLPYPVYNFTATESQVRDLIQLSNYNIYKAGTRERIDGYTIDNYFPHGGGGGTSDYNELENKPSINNHTLRDNSSLEDIGALEIPETGEIGDALTITNVDAQGKPSHIGSRAIQEFDPNIYDIELNCIVSE
jgi:hypothetical protein